MHSNCMSVLRVYKCLNWLILITLRVEEQKHGIKIFLVHFYAILLNIIRLVRMFADVRHWKIGFTTSKP